VRGGFSSSVLPRLCDCDEGGREASGARVALMELGLEASYSPSGFGLGLIEKAGQFCKHWLEMWAGPVQNTFERSEMKQADATAHSTPPRQRRS